jgi:hypothetical protein
MRRLALAFIVLPTLASAQAISDKLSVHGYLTQAYGIADRYLSLGVSRDGTSDLRRAAILGRYSMTASDNVVVQVAHRRLGDSPTNQFEESVKLDMAFYEHRFPAGTSARVGKMALPWGIYNEIRYAGTLTPFYRAPFVIYRDGTYTSETIDGVGVSHNLRAGEPWELALDGYAGGFEQVEFGAIFPQNAAPSYVGAILKSKNVVGGRAWLTTPVTGLRVGLSGRRQTDVGGIYDRPGGASGKLWNASLDGSFDRWMIRAERQHMKTFGFEMTAMYAQAGVDVLPWLTLNAQTELRDERLRYTPTSPWLDVKAGREHAFGTNFHLSTNSVLKLEAHALKGYGFLYEQIVDASKPPLMSSSFIASFSISY